MIISCIDLMLQQTQHYIKAVLLWEVKLCLPIPEYGALRAQYLMCDGQVISGKCTTRTQLHWLLRSKDGDKMKMLIWSLFQCLYTQCVFVWFIILIKSNLCLRDCSLMSDPICLKCALFFSQILTFPQFPHTSAPQLFDISFAIISGENI